MAALALASFADLIRAADIDQLITHMAAACAELQRKAEELR